MRNRIQILDVNIDCVTMEQAVERMMGYLEGSAPRRIFTPNPEIIMEAKKNPDLFRILQEADLVVADGIGVVIGSKLQKQSLPERVAGYDLVQKVFRQIAQEDKTVYFFGGKPGVAEKAKAIMEEKHPGLKIIGVRSGYFTAEEEKLILEDIQQKSPDLLLVGLGAPKQEIWIDAHLSQLPVKVIVGVGGSFDVMSGIVKRAPAGFRKLGLEWFYRLITQPTRAKRMLQLPIFMLHVIKERFLSRREE